MEGLTMNNVLSEEYLKVEESPFEYDIFNVKSSSGEIQLTLAEIRKIYHAVEIFKINSK
jgi:hypothetical protein